MTDELGVGNWELGMTRLTRGSYFGIFRNMDIAGRDLDTVARFADMFAAIGAEARLRILQILLSAHPDGMFANEIGQELSIPSSTLSHHLDKLKNEELVRVQREGTFLRYTANTEALQELLGFLYAECCTRNRAVKPRAVTSTVTRKTVRTS